MEKKEFEKRRSAQLNALKLVDQKPGVRVIELIELLLSENPGLPVVVQVGSKQYSIACVFVDDKGVLRICI
ncbi:hypothetical protein ES707_15761 [subsurface metagenome]